MMTKKKDLEQRIAALEAQVALLQKQAAMQQPVYVYQTNPPTTFPQITCSGGTAKWVGRA